VMAWKLAMVSSRCWDMTAPADSARSNLCALPPRSPAPSPAGLLPPPLPEAARSRSEMVCNKLTTMGRETYKTCKCKCGESPQLGSCAG
jgi:hypothetical protein